jgi:hypothetical protein
VCDVDKDLRKESWAKVEGFGAVESEILDETKKFLEEKTKRNLKATENKAEIKDLLIEWFPDAAFKDEIRKMKTKGISLNGISTEGHHTFQEVKLLRANSLK